MSSLDQSTPSNRRHTIFSLAAPLMAIILIANPDVSHSQTYTDRTAFESTLPTGFYRNDFTGVPDATSAPVFSVSQSGGTPAVSYTITAPSGGVGVFPMPPPDGPNKAIGNWDSADDMMVTFTSDNVASAGFYVWLSDANGTRLQGNVTVEFDLTTGGAEQIVVPSTTSGDYGYAGFTATTGTVSSLTIRAVSGGPFFLNITHLAAAASAKTEETVTDIDGNVYTTVQIGDQLWMAENLRTSRYADGSSIANVTDGIEWSGLSTGAWAHYGNDASNETPYGKLYNWYAVADTGGICPEGWHVPSDAEWWVLADFLGGESVAGGKMKATGTDYWQSPNIGATNESGFTALPGGDRNTNGSFNYQGYFADFWSSSESSSAEAWDRGLAYVSTALGRVNGNNKRNGFSVRCLRDIDPLTLSDVKVTSVASTSVTAQSTVLFDGGASITRRGVVWGATADLSLADNLGVADDDSTGTGVFEVEISGLAPLTTYHVRSFAINADADTAYSTSTTFTTKTEITVTDIDGNVYSTVQIGDQVWMAENLRTSRYADGSSIANVTDGIEWAGLSTGAWVHYDNDPANETPYGKLYNGYTVADGRGFCPEGWRVPRAADIDVLLLYLGATLEDAGGYLKATGTDLWAPPNLGATNESGFTALPGGWRDDYGVFERRREIAAFFVNNWSIQVGLTDQITVFMLSHTDPVLSVHAPRMINGASVRCILNIEPLSLSEVSVSELTASSARFGSAVTFGGDAALIRRGVVWGAGADVSLTNHLGVAEDNSIGIGSFSVDVTNLQPSTSYHVRAYAIHVEKDTVYSPPAEFSTLCDCQPHDPVTDIDGNAYSTVRIGDQVWMAENLRTSRYADGTEIPNVTDAAEWSGLGTEAWAHYDNDATNEALFGKLYNGYAAIDARGLCPSGWRVPNDDDWRDLSVYLGGEGVAGGKLKASGTDYWLSPNTGATNESGFTSLPGGYRYDDGLSYDMARFSIYWSSSPVPENQAWNRQLFFETASIVRSSLGMRNGFSVRCLKGSVYPLRVATDVQRIHITSTTATVSSKVLSDGGSAVVRRGFVLGTSADVNLSVNLGVADDDSTGLGTFEVELTGLTPSTTYHIRAFVINADADTSYSDATLFTTMCAVCSSGEPVFDTDSIGYRTIQIGSQLWMAENLRTSRYADGTEIHNVTDDNSWMGAGEGAWAHYGNDPANEATYGKLYNGLAAVDSRGLCPAGWSVPREEDWTALVSLLGGHDVAGGKMKEVGTVEYGDGRWPAPNTGATNESGFTALPGSIRAVGFGYLNVAVFWSSERVDQQVGAGYFIGYDRPSIWREEVPIYSGFSVRCLRAAATGPSVTLSATPVSQLGTSLVSVSVSELTVSDAIITYEFDLPLPASVSVDSLVRAGTQSASSSGNLQWNVVDDGQGGDLLKVVYADTEPLPGGDAPLVGIAVTVTSQEGAVLQPSAFYLNVEQVTNLGNVTLTFAPMLGDVDADGDVRAFDAALVLQYVVGKDPLPDADPRPWEAPRVAAADVDGDSVILAMDASWILQYLVKLIPDWPANTPTKGMDAPKVVADVKSDTLVFSAGATGLLGFQVDLPQMEGLIFGEPVNQWEDAMIVFAEDDVAGVLKIGFATSHTQEGIFLKIPYELDPVALDGNTSLSVEMAAVVNTDMQTLAAAFMPSGTGVSTENGGFGEDGNTATVPEQFELRAMVPNPFNPSTQVTFTLPKASQVLLEVYDTRGRRVAVLVDETSAAGVHTVRFEADSLPSGVYIARLTAPGFVQSRAMVLIK